MSAVVWLEARPRNAQTGAVEVVRLAGGGSATPYLRDGQHYRAGILTLPRLSAALGIDERGWTGRTVPTATAIEWQPAEPALLEQLAQRYWRDAAVTIDVGEEAAAPVRRLTGAVAAAQVVSGKLILTLADLSDAIDKPLITATFAGTGGLEGGELAKDRPKRRSFGTVAGIEARLLDPANNIFELGDPAHPLTAITALRDKGRAGPIVQLAAGATPAATLAALAASVPPRGGGVVAPSIACVKWWTQPVGPFTADLVGTVAPGPTGQRAAPLAQLVATLGGLGAIANLAEATGWRTGTVGAHVEDGQETFAQVIDRLLLGAGLLWVVEPAGGARIGQWAYTAPVEALQGRFIGREKVLPPVKARTLTYRRNHSIHGASDVAAALSYDDGTPIEDLRPAQPGATRTAYLGEYAAGATYQPGDVVVWTATAGGDGNGWARTGTGASTGIAPGGHAQSAALWVKVVDRGATGPGAVSMTLTNEAAILAADAAGVVASYAPAATEVVVREGAVDVSADFDVAIEANPQELAVTITGRQVAVTGGLDPAEDAARLVLRATGRASTARAGVVLARVLTIAKSRAGAAGSAAKLLVLTSDRQQLTYNAAGAATPAGQSVAFAATRQNSTAAVGWQVADATGALRVPLGSFLTVAADGLTATMSEAQFASARNGTPGVIVSAAIIDGGTIADRVSIVRTQDGAAGAPGAPGAPGSPGATGPQGPTGATGDRPVIIWRRSAGPPATPTGNGLPAGWAALPPAGADSLWSSTGRQTAQDVLVGSWGQPVRQSELDPAEFGLAADGSLTHQPSGGAVRPLGGVRLAGLAGAAAARADALPAGAVNYANGISAEALRPAEAAADVSKSLALNPTALVLRANADGVLYDGQLPVTIAPTFTRSGVNANAAQAWSFTRSSTLTAAQDTTSTTAARGTVTLTDATGDGTIRISAGGLTETCRISVVRDTATAVAGTSTATTATQSSYGTVNAGSYPAAPPVIQTTRSSAAGQLRFASSWQWSGENVTLEGKVVYRPGTSGAWIDAAPAVVGSTSTASPEFEPGLWSASNLVTGLTASTAYQWGVMMRRIGGSVAVTPQGSTKATQS